MGFNPQRQKRWQNRLVIRVVPTVGCQGWQPRAPKDGFTACRHGPADQPVLPRKSQSQAPQRSRMMPQMIIDKAGDEEVAVIVTRLPTQGQRMPNSSGRRFQGLGLELFGEEVIRIALVNQQRQTLRRIGNQLTGIPLLPLFPVVAQIVTEGLLPP